MVKIRWDNDYYFIYAGALYRCGASKDSYRHYRFVNHPELRDNECFWSNVDASKVDATLRAHPTYRVGQTAYDIYGNELPSMQPVFRPVQNDVESPPLYPCATLSKQEE